MLSFTSLSHFTFSLHIISLHYLTSLAHFILQSQALEARDALSKKLYANLFDWLILSINHSLAGQVDVDASAKSVFIAVLDIFGFEAFEHNRYYITNTTTSTTTTT
jgi:hypothetical protein